MFRSFTVPSHGNFAFVEKSGTQGAIPCAPDGLCLFHEASNAL